MIIFENIDTGETVGIDRQTGGKYYRAKLSAVMNSSNMSPNSDRGQDFGWRLIPEQQALIEQWESDPNMIDRVSTWSKVMLDDLTHSEFLAYMLYQQELGNVGERGQETDRRSNQRDYETRVAALKSGEAAPMPRFDSTVARGEATVEDFLAGGVTGDASGDKVNEEAAIDEDALADLDKVLAETGTTPPVLDTSAAEAEKPVKTSKAKK